MADNSGSAFPSEIDFIGTMSALPHKVQSTGLTKLELLSAMAMSGMLFGCSRTGSGQYYRPNETELAQLSVGYAKALILELAKESE